MRNGTFGNHVSFSLWLPKLYFETTLPNKINLINGLKFLYLKFSCDFLFFFNLLTENIKNRAEIENIFTESLPFRHYLDGSRVVSRGIKGMISSLSYQIRVYCIFSTKVWVFEQLCQREILRIKSQ